MRISDWSSDVCSSDLIEEVQLDLEVEEPPAPQREPETADEIDPATEAFARLEGEMAMVRHTVQNMARERADIVIPDYTATLSQMADQLAQASTTLSRSAERRVGKEGVRTCSSRWSPDDKKKKKKK